MADCVGTSVFDLKGVTIVTADTLRTHIEVTSSSTGVITSLLGSHPELFAAIALQSIALALIPFAGTINALLCCSRGIVDELMLIFAVKCPTTGLVTWSSPVRPATRGAQVVIAMTVITAEVACTGWERGSAPIAG